MNDELNMSIADRDEFDRLLASVIDGSVTPSQHERLDDLLRQHVALRDRYLETTGLHLDLLELARPRSGSLPVRTAPSRRWMSTLAVAITALGLLLACGWMWFGSARSIPGTPDLAVAPPPPTVVEPVVIDEAAGARIFGHAFAPAPGQTLKYGEELILKQGLLALRFPSGARAVLESPSVFSPSGPETLLVTSGRCSVHAPPGAEGFRVETPSALIVDLGTRFAVDVDTGGETALKVVEGAASLAARAAAGAPSPRLLREGDAAYVDHDSRPLPEPPVGLNVQFVDRLPDRVVRYEATTGPGGHAEDLLTVTVQRNGVATTYGRERLVRSRLSNFSSIEKSAALCVLLGADPPVNGQRLDLMHDWSLVTGVINPARRGMFAELNEAEGVEIMFDEPVVNGPGPEIVLFDLQILVHDESGDAVRVTPVDPAQGVHSLKINGFDLDLSCPQALDVCDYQTLDTTAPIKSIDELRTAVMKPRVPRCLRAKCLATAIDLSAMGYEPGAKVSRLLLQADPDDVSAIDPVLVVGLPAQE